MTNYIKVVVFDDEMCERDYTIEEFRDVVEGAARRFGGHQGMVTLKADYDMVRFTIWYTRLETPEETAEREARNANWEKTREIQERKQLAALKAKYEDK